MRADQVALAVVIGLLGAPTPTMAADNPNDQPDGVEQAAERRQDFYPVGGAQGDGYTLGYYVFGGPLLVRKQPVVRGAVLINGSGGHQMVEISSINCATHKYTLSFVIVWSEKHELLASTGPADPKNVSLLSPYAMQRTADILCEGIVPPDAIKDKVLKDFQLNR